MINIGNETYPNSVSDLVNQSEVEPPDLDQSDDDQGWEHIRVAVVAILAGVISFLTIVGNIMVGKTHSSENFIIATARKGIKG